MPKFFFNVADHDIVNDPEGVDLPDRSVLKEEALTEMRELLADGALQGLDRSSWSLIVSDERGQMVMFLPFKSALRPDTLNRESQARHKDLDADGGAGH